MPDETKPVQASATEEQDVTLEVDGARMAHIDLAKTASTTGIYQVRTWECPACKIRVIQGDPCPNCDKRLLLG